MLCMLQPAQPGIQAIDVHSAMEEWISDIGHYWPKTCNIWTIVVLVVIHTESRLAHLAQTGWADAAGIFKQRTSDGLWYKCCELHCTFLVQHWEYGGMTDRSSCLGPVPQKSEVDEAFLSNHPEGSTLALVTNMCVIKAEAYDDAKIMVAYCISKGLCHISCLLEVLNWIVLINYISCIDIALGEKLNRSPNAMCSSFLYVL